MLLCTEDEMEREYDVAALGELLIDMTDNGRSGQGNVLYEANPGGAPCNVLSMLKKLGHTVGIALPALAVKSHERKLAIALAVHLSGLGCGHDA